ncbi:helix-turn-helix domain-containing protein [Undibacterium sp. Xuan67W]|uniref:helix-turn-helix domain-containing protein n=1 Tax=Undibacterium sp. Xuan67W TaxID=3413057 RepID=UPI003BF36C76
MELFTENQTADLLQISRQTLSNWRCTKPEILPFVKVGRLVRYRNSDIENFIESNVFGGVSIDRV